MRKPADDRLLTTEQVAERLGVKARTLEDWRYRYKNRGPAWVKVMAGVRYWESAVDAWLQQQAKGA